MISKTSENKRQTYVQRIRISFEAIAVYRGIIEGPVLKKLYKLFKFMSKKDGNIIGFLSRYNQFYSELVNSKSSCLTEYLIDQILYADNAFTRLSEGKSTSSGYVIESAANDLNYIAEIASIEARDIKTLAMELYASSEYEKSIVKELGEWKTGVRNKDELTSKDAMTKLFSSNYEWGSKLKELQVWHVLRGSGEFARYKGFIWQKRSMKSELLGIAAPDPVKLEDLVGYEQERRLIIDNTKCFLKGLPANNILLYGDRGTGKSATIKAIVNEYFEQGLRVIELPKEHLNDLSILIRLIKDRKQKFIIFIDDLAFGDNEDSYTALKAVLEGGLENRASNIVIYATSNRRHLIKEKFSDRAGFMSDNPEDEIQAGDTLQEKLSLADRFGITITYSSPDKEKYLQIVEGLALKRGIEIEKEILNREAMKWELRYNGKSPRTAKQFVDYLEGKLRLEVEDIY